MTVTTEDVIRRLRISNSSLGLGVECPVCKVEPGKSCVSHVSGGPVDGGWMTGRMSSYRGDHTRKRQNPHPERLAYQEGFNAGMAEMAQIIVAAIKRQEEW